MRYQKSTTRGLTMDQIPKIAEYSVANEKKELEYEPPELIEINMLDESAVGFSGMDEPLPPE